MNSERIKKILKKNSSNIYALLGSLLLTLHHLHSKFGWPQQPFSRKRALISCFIFLVVVFLASRLGKLIYHKLANRWKLADFWKKDFSLGLDKLFLLAAAAPLISFFDNEFFKLIVLSFLFIIIYFFVDRLFRGHQFGHKWQLVNRWIFFLSYFVFLINSVFQIFSYQYYLLNYQIKLENAAFLRAWVISMIWLSSFAAAGYFFSRWRGFKRFIPGFIWLVLVVIITLIEIVNAGLVYFSGLYINPIAVFHAEGAGAVILSAVPFYLMLLFFIPLAILFFVVYKIYRLYPEAPDKYWRAYLGSLLVLSLVAFVTQFGIIKHTPEFIIAKSFYDYWRGVSSDVELSPVVRQKLERFGLFYDPEDFYVINIRKDQQPPSSNSIVSAFEQSSGRKPNIIYIALESFSCRLSDVYNDKLPGITPNLVRMAEDENTTVFYNFYNASTPTITGLISQMCSFLPPMGHNEIGKVNMRFNRLSCLPNILRKNGYNYTAYITAVEKEYSSKDTIFDSMGMDEVLGSKEIGEIIKQPSRSTWGYSDHQTFPVMDWIIENKAKEPFFILFSTVDSHQPFNLVSDIVNYQDGKSPLLNTIHTTDDAFGIFWQRFKSSELYENTIVVVAADHAIFPRSYSFAKDYFPEEAEGRGPNVYDRSFLMIYVPKSTLPKRIETYSSSIDMPPTLMEILGVEGRNLFDGKSILSDRKDFPNILGMHEFGLYINQLGQDGARQENYSMPQELFCDSTDISSDSQTPLSLCEYLNFYKWKRLMLEEGRLWDNKVLE
jgi:phosphoglycerol transferase MdoB-like AlkP superfamily enzyme